MGSEDMPDSFRTLWLYNLLCQRGLLPGPHPPRDTNQGELMLRNLTLLALTLSVCGGSFTLVARAAWST